MGNYGYFIVVIGIVLPVLLVRYVLRTSARYGRLLVRNRDMQKLASEFGLTFETKLPGWLKFMWTYYSERNINKISGTLNQHSVDIQDWAKMSLVYRRTFTKITIDGQAVPGSLQHFTLGSSRILSSVVELRTFLQTLA